MPTNQKQIVLPDWLNDIVETDVEMGAGPGVRGRAPLLGVWHAALALYTELPRDLRVAIAKNMRIERAPEEVIEKIKTTYWPYLVLRSTVAMADEDRELFMDCLENCPEFVMAIARRYKELEAARRDGSLQSALEAVRPQKPSSRSSDRPKRGRPAKK